ncbi:MAG TPA: PIN domain-containing protein [Candidatus Binatia bacterium]|nr:PIN domain-containing protein [Candidatus Binatia bacterium]
MIALDTSALVRYLTDDEPTLAARVAELVDGDEEVGIPALVLLEAVHVLRGAPYRRDNPELADALVDLLARENVRLVGLDAELAGAAIRHVRDRSARHLADALISASAAEAGARQLVTTDRRFVADLVPLLQIGDG